MSVNGVNNSGGNDIFSMMFGTADTTSAGSNILGDYSLIQSGAYKKLLKAYYAQQDGETNSTEATEEEKAASVALLNTKTNADALTGAMETLRSKSLYESTGLDEDGKPVYKTEEIVKAVKSFVDAYNSYLDSADDVDSNGILRKAVNVVNATSANAGLLSDIGIEIGEDNKLTLDEDKLKEAGVTALSSLFCGSGTYGDRIRNLASASYKLANSELYSNRHASSYTFNGQYSILGTGNGILDKYL